MFLELRIFNLLKIMFLNLVEVYRKWYRYFFKLEVMDFLYNLFIELEFDLFVDVWGVFWLMMNMFYNNVIELKVVKFEEFVNMEKLFIDFSDNLLNCICIEEMR